MDYGPMFATLRSKEWLLTPHAVTVVTGRAQSNAFKVAGPHSHVAPVVFADDSSPTVVAIRLWASEWTTGTRVAVMHVGGGVVNASYTLHKGSLLNTIQVTVPTVRGCALVLVSP